MPHCFEIDGVLKLLQRARDHSESDWLLICVTFVHALRASEAVGLTVDNIIGTKLVVRRKKKSSPVEDELLVHRNPLPNETKAVFELCELRPRIKSCLDVRAHLPAADARIRRGRDCRHSTAICTR